MKYQVPQFIETEDKLFGPLTAKQFLYVAGGVAGGFMIWSLIPIKFIGILIAAPVFGFFMALAFYRYNDRPFVTTVESAVKYYLGDKLYIWQKRDKKIEPNKTEVDEEPSSLLDVPKLSDSKLKDISWSLDVDEKLNN